ncbi:MAG TPA: DNA internalization-related competence protein ComEC/Rec2 [Gemmatimonadaceae bacterium]
MPLIAQAAMAYASGLFAGFAGRSEAWLALLAAAGAGGAVAVLRRDGRWGALAAVLAAGVLAARTSAVHEARCLDRLAHQRVWRMTLLVAAAPGAFAPAEASAPGCVVRASLSVRRGSARAGERVLAYGAATPTARRLVVRQARLVPGGGRARLPAARAAAGSRIDRVFRRDAPLVRALLIADTRALDPALRDRFAAAGIVHMLSISGLHVAIIAGAMELVFVALGLPRGAALGATGVATACYIAVIGAPAPAVRSGVMLGVAALSRVTQRPTSPWAALAIGAAAPLAAPRTVLDIGWQLSVVGMASLIASGALVRRWVVPRLEGWRANLASVALASTVASAVSAPLVAWSFGRVSLAAPLTNIVATPVIVLLQPALFLAALCSPVLPVARFLADGAHPLVMALDGIARAGASLPAASIAVAPTLRGAVLAGGASVALIVACVVPFPGRALVAALLSLTGAVWLPLLPARSGMAELHLIDVGQGDAVALRTPAGRWVVVDAGRAWRGGDAGRATVIPYLRRRGGGVALFVLTHPHADHAGGAASLMRALRPGMYWDGAYVGTSPPYRQSLAAARDAGVEWRRTHPGDSVSVDGVVLTVLAPDSTWMSSLDDPNEASVVLLARYGAVRFLLMGDAERGEESWLLAHAPDALRADVLKVGHHGSGTSSTAPFLDRVGARVALVSVGAGNAYGLPSPAVMRALARRGAVVLRTDRLGSVVVRTDGHRITITEEGDQWTLSGGRSPH